MYHTFDATFNMLGFVGGVVVDDFLENRKERLGEEYFLGYEADLDIQDVESEAGRNRGVWFHEEVAGFPFMNWIAFNNLFNLLER